jgi:serine protease AprX
LSRIRRWSLGLCLAAAVVAFCPYVPAETGLAAAAPAVRVDTTDGTSDVWVETQGPDGSLLRTQLRKTRAGVVPGPSGRDPSGRAAFATWDEANDGRWFSYSRDAGLTWSRARRLRPELLLRDGAVRPGDSAPKPVGELALPTDGRLFMVQFRVIGLPEWRQALSHAGAELLQYFPYNAHLVRMDPLLVHRISRLEFVERVLPYHPAYRLEAGLREWALGAPHPSGSSIRRVRVIAFERGPEAKSRIASVAAQAGASVVGDWPTGHVIELDVAREQLIRIAALDDVMWVDGWMPPESDMDLVREDSGTDWVEDNLGYCGQGVRGEVMDSGIETGHQDFGTVLMHGANTATSHGTQAYGIVFGDGTGLAGARGQLPCAEQGISADWEFLADRFAHTQELLGAPYFASFQTNSWGNGTSLDYSSHSFEMDDIIWQLDIAITQSQSNSGSQLSRPEAWAKNVISVGGIQHLNTLTTTDDTWGSFASTGPAADGRVKPDVSYWNDLIYTTDTGNSYADFGGTSASTPEVAGVLGVLLQMWSENVWGTNPGGATVFERKPHFSTLKALLINNAEQYTFSGEFDDLSRFKQGWGRPSARVALDRAPTSFVIDETFPLELGESTDFVLNVAPGESELKVTMVYPDPPGTTSATLHRINDLDLAVTSPSGVTYHGNSGLLDTTASDSSLGANTLDTVENVFVPAPEPGPWLGRIGASEINQDAHGDTPEDDAAYAMVATGATGAVCGGIGVDFSISPPSPGIGELVHFNSSVTGDAPAPFSFEWDLDGDGTIDSTDAHPTWVYGNYFGGDVTMNVRDANQCPASVTKPVTVDGPGIVVDGVAFTTQIRGNSNGSYDPGETWAVVLRLANNGTQDALEVTARLELAEDTPGGVLLLQDTSMYGDILAGGTANGLQSYRVQIGQGFPCGVTLSLNLRQISSTTPEHVYPDVPGAVQLPIGGTGPPVVFFGDSFEFEKGWTESGTDGEWELAVPGGLGGPSPDPTSAYDGAKVLGNDLSGLGVDPGNYEHSIISTLTSPSIDASQATGVEVRFARWLNVAPGDQVIMKVRDGAGGPSSILINESSGFVESSWNVVDFDVSAVADGSSDLRFEFLIGSDSSATDSGWNIDAFEVLGLTPASCEPHSRPGPGDVAHVDITRQIEDDEEFLVLDWTPDCAEGTGYSVYRGSLEGGYGSAVSIACDLEETNLVIPDDAGDVFFFVAPSDGFFEGNPGSRGDGTPRPTLPSSCYPQDVYDACGN